MTKRKNFEPFTVHTCARCHRLWKDKSPERKFCGHQCSNMYRWHGAEKLENSTQTPEISLDTPDAIPTRLERRGLDTVTTVPINPNGLNHAQRVNDEKAMALARAKAIDNAIEYLKKSEENFEKRMQRSDNIFMFITFVFLVVWCGALIGYLL